MKRPSARIEHTIESPHDLNPKTAGLPDSNFMTAEKKKNSEKVRGWLFENKGCSSFPTLSACVNVI